MSPAAPAGADTAPEPAPVLSTTCGLPVWSSQPPSDQLSTITDPPYDHSAALVGEGQNLGATGAELGLLNPVDPVAPVNIIEDRSLTGAGWQSGYWLRDPTLNRLWIFNQSDGNAVGYQWGEGVPPGWWAPDPSDHYYYSPDKKEQVNFTDPQTGTSACDSSSVVLDNERSTWQATTTGNSGGHVTTVVAEQDLQSLYDQTWPDWAFAQGIYLNKWVAWAGDLSIYLSGPGWTSGPIQPQLGADGVFSVSGVPSQYLTDSCPQPPGQQSPECQYGVGDLTNIELAYRNIMGTEVDVDISLSPSDPITWLTSVPNTYCGDSTNPACGTIALNYYLQVTSGYSAPVGAIRSYSVTYNIGTPAALEAAGQPVAGAAPQIARPGIVSHAPNRERLATYNHAVALTKGKL